MGTLFTIGPLGIDVANDTNLDVSSAPTGRAFMTARSATGTDFYTIDLSTGAATRINTIAGTMQVFGMAVGQASLVFTIPVMGSATGQNNTSFRSDLSITNSSAFSVPVTIDFFEAGGAAKTGPTGSVQLTLAAGEQRTVADIVKTLFNRDPGTGAIRVTASRPISVVGRIFNDTPNGTFGQFIRGAEDAERRSSGVLPALKNTPSIPNTGFRTNIGWFNPNTTDLNVTFTARALDGMVLDTATVLIPALTQSQLALNQLFDGLDFSIDTYVTFTSVNTASPPVATPLFVYASVIDNITGDAIFIPALRNN
jgi:hypothetical protein